MTPSPSSKTEAPEPSATTPGGANSTSAATPNAHKPDFLTEHFGNPEGDELYGTANDYESEPDQIKDEKRAAGQAIWYLGAFLLLVALVSWLG